MVSINCIELLTTVQIFEKLIDRNRPNYVTRKLVNKCQTTLRSQSEIRLK